MKKLDELEKKGGKEFTEAIIEMANSKSSLNNVNAILFGAKHRLIDPRFIDALERLLKSDAKILGNEVSVFAGAALHVLGVREYTGDDSLAKDLIEAEFNVI